MRRGRLILSMIAAALAVWCSVSGQIRAEPAPIPWPANNERPELDRFDGFPLEYDSVPAAAELSPRSWSPAPPPEQPGLTPLPFDSSPDAEEDDGSAPPAIPWQLTAVWLAPGGASGFGTTDIDVHRSSFLHFSPRRAPLVVTPGFGSHSWVGPKPVDLPPQVYDAYLDFTWQAFQTERTQLRMGITPGLYGDFQKLDGHAFQLTGWLLGDWALSDRWTVVGGVAYVRQLQNNILPVGGIIWATPDTRVELLIPRPRIARRWRQTEGGDSWLYLAGQLGGGSWAVVQPNGTNERLTYSDLRLSLGVEWSAASRYSGTVEVGYVFARDLTAFGGTIFLPSDTVMVQAGLAF